VSCIFDSDKDKDKNTKEPPKDESTTTAMGRHCNLPGFQHYKKNDGSKGDIIIELILQ